MKGLILSLLLCLPAQAEPRTETANASWNELPFPWTHREVKDEWGVRWLITNPQGWACGLLDGPQDSFVCKVLFIGHEVRIIEACHVEGVW